MSRVKECVATWTKILDLTKHMSVFWSSAVTSFNSIKLIHREVFKSVFISFREREQDQELRGMMSKKGFQLSPTTYSKQLLSPLEQLSSDSSFGWTLSSLEQLSSDSSFGWTLSSLEQLNSTSSSDWNLYLPEQLTFKNSFSWIFCSTPQPYCRIILR